MHETKQFTKKTKAGGVRQVVREHYLRDDIWSGSPLDSKCPPDTCTLSGTAQHYLLIDTNVALHQLDFLEHPAISDVIVCSVVLEEVRHKNQAAYQRMRALTVHAAKRFYVFSNEHHRETYITAEPGESPNDRNDRAIRRAAEWYNATVPSIPTLLLTNDADNRRKAVAAGLPAFSVRAYCIRHQQHLRDLQDVVAACGSVDDEAEEEAGGKAGRPPSPGEPRSSKRSRLFPDHLPLQDLMAGIKEGKYHQGALRVSRFNAQQGTVSSDSVGEAILVAGREHMNRAFDGDLVCVELLPQAQWRGSSKHSPGQGQGEALGSDTNNAVGSATATPAGEEEDEPKDVFQVAPGEHFNDIIESGAAAKQPTGRVLGIIKRNWRARGYCGSLQPPKPGQRALSNRSAAVLFMPVEKRFPMIRIQTRQAETLMDKRIVVAVDGWDVDSAYPHGHYVRTLGVIGDKATETEVILHEHDINTQPFSPAVHDCVPQLPWSVSEAERSDPRRMDLRHLCVCSVDPPGCRDIDDALHARMLPNGNFEVGVHIADVTHFLLPGTAMDAEASARATTTYLVDRRIDMLPKPLTEDICSLRAGVERLTFSVLWEVQLVQRRREGAPGGPQDSSNSPPSPAGSRMAEVTAEADAYDAKILSSTFTKALIRSRAALTYAQAQELINASSRSDELSAAQLAEVMAREEGEYAAQPADSKGAMTPSQRRLLTSSLCYLMKISKILRRERYAAGALQLASPEVKFKLSAVRKDKDSNAAERSSGAPGAPSAAAASNGADAKASRPARQEHVGSAAAASEATGGAAPPAAAALQPTVVESSGETEKDPTDVGMYQTLDTNNLVEEMMLLANQAVAEKALRHFPSCALLRRHQEPAPKQFEPVVQALAALGFSLDVSESKKLAESLDQAQRADDAYFNKLVRIMTTRCMTQAQYFGSGDVGPAEYNHYGLASALYTHFTSPIRRYADVVVHRLLAASIDLTPLPDSARDKSSLARCADNLNKRHYNAQQAGRASTELYTLIFFKDRTVLADARVTKVKANGLVVFVPKFGIEAPVYLTDKDMDKDKDAGVQTSSPPTPMFTLDEQQQKITSADGCVSYQIFQKVAVCISVAEGIGHRRYLVMKLVPREALSPEDLVAPDCTHPA